MGNHPTSGVFKLENRGWVILFNPWLGSAVRMTASLSIQEFTMLVASALRVAASAFLAFALGAQDAPRPWAPNGPQVGQHSQGQRREGALAQLGLSEAQRAHIRQIREKRRGGSLEARKKMRFEVLAVLTEVQRETLFRLEANRRQNRGQGRGRGQD
jgi:Spy/CpxP family protein refolding chaperone